MNAKMTIFPSNRCAAPASPSQAGKRPFAFTLNHQAPHDTVFFWHIDRLRQLKTYYTTQVGQQSRYRFFAPETPQSIAAVEQKTGLPVPPDLRDLLLTVGGFSMAIDIDGFVLTYLGTPRTFQLKAVVLDESSKGLICSTIFSLARKILLRTVATGHCMIIEISS